MESFEHLCKVALETEGCVVTSNVKFPVRRRTAKASREEFQTHGYEVDLVGARNGALVLAEVKSFFGSRGVNRQSFLGLADTSRRYDYGGYKLLNDPKLRTEVVRVAAERYGYTPDQVELRLYVGKFTPGHQEDVVAHLAAMNVKVVALDQIVQSLIEAAGPKTYTDDPVIMTVKALAAAGRLPAVSVSE